MAGQAGVMPGTVSLVSVDPDDDDLLTCAAVDRLRLADLVVYDRSAGPAILAHSLAEPELVCVDSGGATWLSPSDIHTLLAARAAAGLHVVRLMAAGAESEPTVTGEITTFLRQAGVPWEMIPPVQWGFEPTRSLPGAALAGRRVLITRPRDQAQEFARQVREWGGYPFLFPTIRILPPVDRDPLMAALGRVDDYDWLIFTSVNGVASVFRALRDAGRDVRDWHGIRLAAVGPATAAALAAAGLQADVVPDEYRGAAVATAVADVSSGLQGNRVLLLRAAAARPELPQELRHCGAVVDDVTAYRTTAATGAEVEIVRDLLKSSGVHIVTFTSPSAVHSFCDCLGDDAHELADTAVVGCIGPVTAAAAEDAGFRVDVVPGEYTVPGLIAALNRHLVAERSTSG